MCVPVFVLRSYHKKTSPHQQGYKSLLRRELQAEFERRQLSDQFFDQNRDQIFADKKVVAFETPAIEENRVSIELTEAVPPTETLNVEAQRARADLARQGSLADRNPPAGLAQVRAKQQAAPQHLAFEPDVTYDDGEPVPDGLDQNSSPVSHTSPKICKTASCCTVKVNVNQNRHMQLSLTTFRWVSIYIAFTCVCSNHFINFENGL